MAAPVFHDLANSKFPLTITAYPKDQEEDRDPLWTLVVESPGAAKIPLGFGPVRIVCRYGDGTEDRS